jgi:GH24 family phage-related lysozyme (muramidase)
MQTIRGFEGYRDVPYMDVNALRAGYGSDTTTRADGSVASVDAKTRVSREDAERDLARRTDEFMVKARGKLGDAWMTLTPNQQAALTSITYNYGELPDRVAKHAGNPAAMAQAIVALGSDNDGVNADRRAKEAALFMGAPVGNPMPGVPNIGAPQLPLPPTTEALRTLDPRLYDQFNTLKVTRPEPLDTGSRITNVLGQMAAGAVGAKNAGDLLLGAGAGAGAGATQNIRQMRKEDADYKEKEDDLKKFLMQMGLRKGEAEAQAANAGIQARNIDRGLLHQVKTQQAQLDQSAKNKLAEIQSELDWKKWERFEPQIKADKDGVTVVTRQPNGGIKIDQHKGNEIDAMADKIRDTAAIAGKDSASVEALRYMALSKQGEPFVRRQIMRDMFEKNMSREVLGETAYKALEKEAEKGLDPGLRGKPEEFDSQKKQRMLDLLWAQKPPDEAWLMPMYKRGHIGAQMLARPE